jgi:hypothetical protein
MFQDLSYEILIDKSKSINGSFAIVKSAHDLYGLQVTKNNFYICSPLILRISYQTIDSNQRPQVLLSGEIHGDERVVLYTYVFQIFDDLIFLLLNNVYRDLKPRLKLLNYLFIVDHVK